jgi:splicing factor U2AF subunit
MQQTKHARRIYIGGIGNDAVDKDIEDFMRDVIRRAMGSNAPAGDPVLSSYVNRDKCFCFLELNSIELTTACCSLDGISYRGNTLKIRRPNDFRPEAMPTNLPPTPVFDLAALGIVGTNVAEGPGKVFVGGLPYHLTEDEIKELLSAFGPLRSFHLVKDTGTIFVLHEILTKVYVIINALCIYLIRCIEFKGIRIL